MSLEVWIIRVWALIARVRRVQCCLLLEYRNEASYFLPLDLFLESFYRSKSILDSCFLAAVA